MKYKFFIHQKQFHLFAAVNRHPPPTVKLTTVRPAVYEPVPPSRTRSHAREKVKTSRKEKRNPFFLSSSRVFAWTFAKNDRCLWLWQESSTFLAQRIQAVPGGRDSGPTRALLAEVCVCAVPIEGERESWISAQLQWPTVWRRQCVSVANPIRKENGANDCSARGHHLGCPVGSSRIVCACVRNGNSANLPGSVAAVANRSLNWPEQHTSRSIPRKWGFPFWGRVVGVGKKAQQTGGRQQKTLQIKTGSVRGKNYRADVFVCVYVCVGMRACACVCVLSKPTCVCPAAGHRQWYGLCSECLFP